MVVARARDQPGAERLEVSTFSPASYPRPENTYYTAEVVTKLKDQDVALLRLAQARFQPQDPAAAQAGGDRS